MKTTRTIILVVIGMVAYVMIANYHGEMKSDLTSPQDQSSTIHQAPADDQKHVDDSHQIADQVTAISEKQHEPQQHDDHRVVLHHDKKETATDHKQDTISDKHDLHPAPHPIDIVVSQQQLNKDLAVKEKQILQILEAQEVVVTKNRVLLQQLEKASVEISELRKEKQHLQKEVQNSKQQANKVASIQALVKNFETILYDREKRLAELTAENQALFKRDQALTTQVGELTTALAVAESKTTATESALHEEQKKSTDLLEIIQTQSSETEKLSSRLTNTTSQLSLAKKAIQKETLKAESMFHYGQEKEKELISSEQQTAALQKVLEQMTAELELAITDGKSLHDAVVAKSEEIQSLALQLENAAATITSKDQELAASGELLEQVEQDRKELNTLAEELDQKNADLQAAQELVTDLESTVALTQASLAETESIKNAQINELELLNSTLAKKDEILAEHEITLAGAELSVQELTNKNQELTEKNLEVGTKIDSMLAEQQAVDTLKAELEEMKTAILALEEEKNGFLMTIDEKTAVLTENATRLEALAELEATVKEVTSGIAEKEAALSEATAQIETLTATASQLETITAELEAVKSTNAELATSLEEQTSQVISLQEDIAVREQEKAALQEKTEAMTAAVEQAFTAQQAEAQEIASKIEKLQQQLTSEQDKRKATLAAMESLKQKQADVASKLAQSENTGQAAQEEIKTLTATIDEQTFLTAKAVKDVAQKEEEITSLENKLSALSGFQTTQQATLKENKNLKAMVKEKAGELKVAKQSIVSLETTNVELQQQLELAKEDAAQALKKTNQLQQEFDTLNSEQQRLVLQTADTDQDGVNDAADKCPETVPGAQVDDTGCEPDTDNDTIVDRIDLCPDSAEGAVVNSLGCAQGENIILTGVTFTSGTANLTTDSQKSLDRTVAILGQAPEMKLEIAGYTDSVGNEARNLKISNLRAQAVVSYLVIKGIEEERLIAKGYGMADPIADNSTVAGRAQNRRVELHPISSE